MGWACYSWGVRVSPGPYRNEPVLLAPSQMIVMSYVICTAAVLAPRFACWPIDALCLEGVGIMQKHICAIRLWYTLSMMSLCSPQPAACLDPLISCTPKLSKTHEGGPNEHGNPSGVLSLVYDALQLIEEVTRNKQLQRWHAVMAAWQRVLPEMYPSMKVGFLIHAHTC